MKDFAASLFCAAVALVIALSWAPCAVAAPFPKSVETSIETWTASSVDLKPLKTVSEDLGNWYGVTYKNSRSAASIEVNFLTGAGAGTLVVPKIDETKNDAPVGFGSTYRVLEISGKKAVLEASELTGIALAIQLDVNKTLTLESKNVLEEALLGFADKLLNHMTF